MSSAELAVLLLIASTFTLIVAANPFNEYAYSFNRDMLIDAEKKFERRTNPSSWSEETVNHYLQYLKWREFKATKNSGFPPSRPIEEKLSDIISSEIYKALVKLPKGGNMHSHENHDVSKKVLLDIVWNSPDFQYVHMLPPTHPTTPWMLDFFVNPPTDDWINLKETNTYTKEEILKYQTFIGILSFNATRYPTDSGMRWKEMGALWDRSSDMISNLPIKKKYIEAMYEIGLQQGVIYFESRKNIYEEIYVLDPSPRYNSTNGRRYLNPMGEQEVEVVLELSRNFAKKHPEFVGHKRISTAQRRSSKMKFDFYMENVVRMHNLYPDHVIGFDAVGEEDAGYALLHYISEWLKLYNSTTGKLRVPLYLHAAETNWPDDLMTSDMYDDMVSTLMNTYESILLSSSRIGHGYGFIKHPYLLSLLKERQIPVETCVVSNQLLGFTPDIRNHPAQHFLRYGIPIVLGSDDAGTFGYDNFTVDWYEAFMAWGLDLEDLKTIAKNSLIYSGLSEDDKKVAIELKWQPMWDKYIMNMYDSACGRDYVAEASHENRPTTFARILPLEGAKTGTTKVHVLGRNFERGICQNVACRFGDRISPKAAYISNQHILCESPDFGDEQERSVEVFLALDGVHFVSTHFNFTYKYDAIKTSTTTPNPEPVSREILSGIILCPTPPTSVVKTVFHAAAVSYVVRHENMSGPEPDSKTTYEAWSEVLR